jgi:hypothetical protein
VFGINLRIAHLSPWQHVRAADCARFGVIGRTYVRVPSDALESATSEHTIKVQFQFTEARRRHVSSAWLALVAPSRVLSNATLQFVHSDRGLLLRVDIDAEYEYVSRSRRGRESGVWSVRHRWQQHESVNRYAGLLWLLGVTFLVTFFTVVYIFVSSWRAFSSGAALFTAPSKSSALPGAAVATARPPRLRIALTRTFENACMLLIEISLRSAEPIERVAHAVLRSLARCGPPRCSMRHQ